MAANAELKVNEGDTAPDFTAPTNGGGEVSLSQFRGQAVVLYFYPKDNTPGCNKEACGFRDNHEAITAKNAVVLGVSADSAAKHDKFIEKFDLPFTLIADEDKSICESYGVWGNKSFMGRTFLGIKRMTFLINADGVVQKVWPKVKVADHANEVLEALANWETDKAGTAVPAVLDRPGALGTARPPLLHLRRG